MRHSIRTAILVSLLLPAFVANTATQAEPEESAIIEVVKSTLMQRFPDVPVETVSATPIPGLFEIKSGDRLVYADSNGDYLLMGPLLDTRTRRNLTEDRIADLQSIDYDALPLERAIKVVKGNGQREFAVFADPDCPFCQQLEKTLEGMTDITVYTFLFPLEALHPGASDRAHRIWCADDAAAAWRDWMLTDKLTSTMPCADNPVPEIRALAQSLKINSTPTLFLPNGRRINGAVSRERLEELLGSGAGN